MIVWVNNTYNGLIEQQQPHKKYEEIEERATITVLHPPPSPQPRETRILAITGIQ